MWVYNYEPDCNLGKIHQKMFWKKEISAKAVLLMHSIRTLNTFFYAFSISGFAIERYFLVCKATENTFVKRTTSKTVFYVATTVCPFLFWLPFLAVLFWDKLSLFTGLQLFAYVSSFLELTSILFLNSNSRF